MKVFIDFVHKTVHFTLHFTCPGEANATFDQLH